ncbi:beta family protein [Leisingera thetidis]|uniref:beta family protein n=1 Tax=Leisingera thetidis TaxID=2930199 RepID=UPI0021F72AC2|nr:beta family protein [Leisingera thetidis]
MAIDLFEAKYIPTIFLRQSELQAVSELPEATKESLCPIFCLKPWATCKFLSQAVDKIEAVFGANRKYFLDIDPFYEVEEVKREAQEEFLALVDEENAVQNWIEFLEGYPNASPCIQMHNSTLESVGQQIQAFTEMDRPFLIRLNHGGGNGRDWSEIVDLVCQTDHSNFGFVIDLEWSKDLLSRIEWADRIVKRVVANRGDGIPVCVNGSSFPNSFTQFEDGGTAPLLERLAFQNLVSNNNQARLIYGDWASSRPPGESLPIKAEIPPRIDLPYANGWEFFRYRRDDGGYRQAATQALASPSYPHGVDIWGTYLIASTAQSEAFDPKDASLIGHPKKAAAARINIHLYRQQNFENFNPAPDTDDDFEDI